jgi:hypothetical protein
MSSTAMANASGAQNSHEFSTKLVDVMDEFSSLIAQFKIEEDSSNGQGNLKASGKERAKRGAETADRPAA